MGKGSRGCLGEGGEGIGPNRLADGDGSWKGVGEVGGRSGRDSVVRVSSGGLMRMNLAF